MSLQMIISGITFVTIVAAKMFLNKFAYTSLVWENLCLFRWESFENRLEHIEQTWLCFLSSLSSLSLVTPSQNWFKSFLIM